MLGRRLTQLTPTGPVLAASLSQAGKRGGTRSRSCRHGGPLHPAHHLTLKDAGKTRTVYLPQELVDEVRTWVTAYQRLKAVPHEVSRLTLARVRGHVRSRTRRRGRP